MERSRPELLDFPLRCHLSQSLSLITGMFNPFTIADTVCRLFSFLKYSLSICHDVAMFGNAWLPGWPSGNGASWRFNSNR